MSIKQHVYPAEGEQLFVLRMHCNHHRAIFNRGLEQRMNAWDWKRWSISKEMQMRELTEARGKYDWIRAGSTVVQQGALRDLDRAYRNFFGKRSGFPTFKSAKDPQQSFTIRDVKIRRISKRWGEIHVPKAGWVRFRISYPMPQLQAATSARMVFERGQWHVALTTPARGKLNGEATAGHIGIDRGVANTLATSDGEFFQAPGFTEREKKRFLALERKLARQPKAKDSVTGKPSRRRQDTLDALTRMRRTLVDRRRDWIEQVTTELAVRHEEIALEKLAIGNMTRRPQPKPDPDNPGAFLPNGRSAKAALNRLILGSCWGKFGQRLKDKTDVIEVNPRFTSQQCHACGHTDARNRENQATFRCVKCGNTGHADVHAGMNIDERGFGSGIQQRPGTQGVRAPQELRELRFHPWSNANLRSAA